MKKILIVLALMLLPATVLAQNLDFVAAGGRISKAGTQLVLPLSTVISVSDSLGQVTTGNIGSFTLVTPPLATGTIANGGTFGPGGSVQVNAPGYATFSGSLASATWQTSTLANGTKSYILTAQFANNAGAFVLQTVNIGKTTFGSAQDIFQVSIHLN